MTDPVVGELLIVVGVATIFATLGIALFDWIMDMNYRKRWHNPPDWD